MKNIMLAILLVAGLALAGSDGPYFPWPNLVGAALFIAFAVGMRKRETTYER